MSDSIGIALHLATQKYFKWNRKSHSSIKKLSVFLCVLSIHWIENCLCEWMNGYNSTFFSLVNTSETKTISLETKFHLDLAKWQRFNVDTKFSFLYPLKCYIICDWIKTKPINLFKIIKWCSKNKSSFGFKYHINPSIETKLLTNTKFDKKQSNT